MNSTSTIVSRRLLRHARNRCQRISSYHLPSTCHSNQPYDNPTHHLSISRPQLKLLDPSRSFSTKKNESNDLDKIESPTEDENNEMQVNIGRTPPNQYDRIMAQKQKATDARRKKVSKTIDRSKFTYRLEIEMPDPGYEVGATLLKWYKKEGDIVVKGDLLCDVETKDFEISLEVDDEYPGIMGEILTPEGTSDIQPNNIICIMWHDPEDVAAHENDDNDDDGDEDEEDLDGMSMDEGEANDLTAFLKELEVAEKQIKQQMDLEKDGTSGSGRNGDETGSK